MPQVWAHYPKVRLLMAGARTTHSAELDDLIAGLDQDLVRAATPVAFTSTV